MRSTSAVLCALLFAAAAVADNTPPQPSSVTSPLSQYEELQKAKENASATAIDTITLGGTFRDHNLTLALTGRSVGNRTETPVLSESPDLTLSGCSGDALLVRGGKGGYAVIALAPSFTLRCEARLSGSDRLGMKTSDAVLAVRSTVSDGELVAGDDGIWTLVRQVVGGNETLATTATGRYRITLLPDTTRFQYVIQVHNPNRRTSPLPLRLLSGEHLQQIDSAAPYEPKDGSYVFAMPPGDSTITLSGELQGTSFAPPVEASLQYLVIESHPLLRPALRSQPKRVSTGETGITTQYRGALAFEIGAHERIAWSVTHLEAMRAISYAVRNASHVLFVPAAGPVLGESTMQLDNQGAPEILIPPKPQPTFVSLQGAPVLMTKNAAGALTVPLSAGDQTLIVQHQQPASHFGIAVARLDLPQLPVPATHTTVTLRYPEHWLPLWQSFATETTTWRPDGDTFVIFVLLAYWLERVMAGLTLKLRPRVVIALMLAFAALIVPVVLWIVVIGAGFVTLLWVASQRSKISLPRLVALLAVIAVILIGAVLYTTATRSVSHARIESAPPMLQKGVTVNFEPNTRAPEQGFVGFAYQGLPAKFELPEGVRSTSFSEEMLAAERPHTVTLVLLSMSLVTWTAIALAVLAALLLWRDRAAIAAAMRARRSEAVPAPAAAT